MRCTLDTNEIKTNHLSIASIGATVLIFPAGPIVADHQALAFWGHGWHGGYWGGGGLGHGGYGLGPRPGCVWNSGYWDGGIWHNGYWSC